MKHVVLESMGRVWALASAVILAGLLGIGGVRAAAPGEGAGGGALSKIRVAGRGFETTQGARFVPFGVNYYRPGTGWAPQIWKKFDPEATRRDLALLRSYGGNCVRVFLTFGSFYQKPGVVDEEALAKFDQFLAMAEEAGIYVHPTGPDHWEGYPAWMGRDQYADENALAAVEGFWRIFAARYKGRNAIFAYDLLNEPMIRWNTPAMQARWNRWVIAHYGSAEKAAQTWGVPAESLKGDGIPVPQAADKPGDPMLLDYQRCREDVADEWTRRQVAAIKGADPDALVTVGLIQWAVPVVLPKPDLYAAFRPQRQAQFLDFLEFHFYPLERGAYEYGGAEQEQRNLAYAQAIAREVAKCGKPVVLAEYGWHGGGSFPMGDRQSKPGSEEDQAQWCSALIETTAPLVAGWLNWGFYDCPEARDVSIHTGLMTADGKEKAWGRRFRELSGRYRGHVPEVGSIGARPDLPWDLSMTSPRAADRFREEYIAAYRAGQPRRP